MPDRRRPVRLALRRRVGGKLDEASEADAGKRWSASAQRARVGFGATRGDGASVADAGDHLTSFAGRTAGRHVNPVDHRRTPARRCLSGASFPGTAGGPPGGPPALFRASAPLRRDDRCESERRGRLRCADALRSLSGASSQTSTSSGHHERELARIGRARVSQTGAPIPAGVFGPTHSLSENRCFASQRPGMFEAFASTSKAPLMSWAAICSSSAAVSSLQNPPSIA